jgi:hypothetical protein
MSEKIALYAENCWVIRSPSRSRPNRFLYWVVANQWDHAPTQATIFRAFDDGQRFVRDMRYYDRIGFRNEDVVEVVPLTGAIRTCGLVVNAKKET